MDCDVLMWCTLIMILVPRTHGVLSTDGLVHSPELQKQLK